MAWRPYIHPYGGIMLATKGSGTKRERRPGVWEIRVAAGNDPVTGRTLQRSVTFHGSDADAELYRVELAAEYAARRSIARAAPMLTVGELLNRWSQADHSWKPSTRVGYASNVKYLLADALAATRVVSLTPRQVRSALARWEADGSSTAVVGGRFRVLRSAIGWAYDERVIDVHPIRNMRGPARPEPRRPLSDDAVKALLTAAECRLLQTVANDAGGNGSGPRRQVAEQDLLLVRLAADSGARRGELAGLQFGDLRGRALHIQRAVSSTEITLPKSGRDRTVTLGASTARLWSTLEADWRARCPEGEPFGRWVFASDDGHHHRVGSGVLDQRFRRIRNEAGVADASLHRLRHSVATFLVARGDILQAQTRLGHRDAATTLREYAFALPATDGEVADAIDEHLDGRSEVEVGFEN
jgi:integrase